MTATEPTQNSHPGPARRRIARVFGWAVKILGVLLVAAVLLVVGTLLYLRTDSGLARLAGLIETLVSSDRMTLTIDSLEGAFPEHLHVENVALTDGEGTLVSVDYAELRWRPWQLLSRHLDISSFDIGTAAVNRLPAQEAAPLTEEAAPTGLPSLPVDVTLDSLQIGELRLGEAIVGQSARLTATASLSATRQGEFAADADVRRLDAVPARLFLTANYDSSAEYLKVNLDANEAEGGLVASLAGLPGAPPVRLEVKGDGPLQDWRGNLKATAGSVADIDAAVSISGQEPRRVVVDGRAAIDGLLPANLAPLVAGGITLRTTADVLSERITVSDLSVSTAAGGLRGQGAFLPPEERIDAEASLIVGPSSVLQTVVPGLTYDAAGATIVVSGMLPVPNLQLNARAAELTAGTLRAGEVLLQAKVAAGKTDGEEPPPIDAQAEFVVSDLVTPSKDLAALLKQPARLRLDGSYDAAERRATVRQLRLHAGPLEVSGTADLSVAEPITGKATLRMEELDLAPLGPLAGISLSGRARLDAAFDAEENGNLLARISGGIDGFASAARELTALLGPNPRLTAQVSGSPASNINFDANFRAAQFTAAADGQLAADMTVVERANLKISADDLTGLRPLLGAPVGGAFSVTAQARGPMEKLAASLQAVGKNIVYQDERIDRLQLTVDARDVPANGEGSLAFDAATSRGPITARGSFKTEGNEQLRIDRFVLTYAEAVTATARLLVPFNGRPIIGNVAIRSDDLAPVGRALDQQLAGRCNLDVVLDSIRDKQRLAAVLRADNLRYGPATAPIAGVGKLSADIEVTDIQATRQLKAIVNADDTIAADGRLTRAMVRATGSNNAYAVHAEANGNLQGLTQVTTDADIRAAEATVITLQRLQAELRDERLRLVRPARLIVAGERLAVEDVAVEYGSAQATFSAVKSPQLLDGRLAVRDLDLRMIEKFQPGTQVHGVVRADVDVSGTPAAPVVNIDARAAGLGMGGSVRQRVASRSPTLAGTLQGRIGGGRGDIDLLGEGLGEVPLRVNLSAPVRFAVEPFAFAVSETGPVSGSVAWQGSIDPVWQMLPIDAFLLSGYANVNLAIGGTIQHPAVTGELTLARGSFEVFETGTVLRPLDIAIEAAPGEVRLTRLEARDGGNGTLTGSGVVVLSDPLRVDSRVELRDFGAVRRDDVVSRVSGSVAANGTVGERLLVSGRIDNEVTEIRLINRLPPSVANVNVVFVDETQAPGAAPAAEAGQREEPWIDLDLTIDLPGRVYVRGRGLSSEWAGSFVITGTSANPQVRGSLQPIRGKLDFLGKTFDLEKGKIGIEGLDQDIMIDMTASYKRSDLKALVIISGTATQPKITLQSDPEMPQDEILARVLFDKPTGKLSATEAAQLAGAAAALASGDPGMLDKLRDATGLDELRLGGPQEEGGLGTVEAGKHVGENVYVGVEQGASAASTAAVVEVDITDNIKLRSTTSAEGSNRVGVQWKWDY